MQPLDRFQLPVRAWTLRRRIVSRPPRDFRRKEDEENVFPSRRSSYSIQWYELIISLFMQIALARHLHRRRLQVSRHSRLMRFTGCYLKEQLRVPSAGVMAFVPRTIFRERRIREKINLLFALYKCSSFSRYLHFLKVSTLFTVGIETLQVSSKIVI